MKDWKEAQKTNVLRSEAMTPEEKENMAYWNGLRSAICLGAWPIGVVWSNSCPVDMEDIDRRVFAKKAEVMTLKA